MTIKVNDILIIIIIIIDCVNIKNKKGSLTIKMSQVHLLDICPLLPAKNELSSLIKA